MRNEHHNKSERQDDSIPAARSVAFHQTHHQGPRCCFCAADSLVPGFQKWQETLMTHRVMPLQCDGATF